MKSRIFCWIFTGQRIEWNGNLPAVLQWLGQLFAWLRIIPEWKQLCAYLTAHLIPEQLELAFIDHVKRPQITDEFLYPLLQLPHLKFCSIRFGPYQSGLMQIREQHCQQIWIHQANLPWIGPNRIESRCRDQIATGVRLSKGARPSYYDGLVTWVDYRV